MSTDATVSAPLANYHRRIAAVLETAGYLATEPIAKSLQGEIWRAIHAESGKLCVIKVASKALHKQKSVIINHQKYVVNENIMKEMRILKYLSSFAECPPSIIRYRDSFHSKHEYYLEMQYGGASMFDFIVKAHKAMLADKLEVANWHKLIKLAFQQIIDGVAFMHSKHISHFDLSLENMTIVKDLSISVTEHGNIEFTKIEQELQVKLIDFGLAERLKSKHKDETGRFRSEKHCGKRNYQCPEIAAGKAFDPMANDVWCCGVALFMMAAGGCPWSVAKPTDECFRLIMQGQIRSVLETWNRLSYFDQDLLDLLANIFQFQEKRISVAQIQRHAWLKPAEASKHEDA